MNRCVALAIAAAAWSKCISEKLTVANLTKLAENVVDSLLWSGSAVGFPAVAVLWVSFVLVNCEVGEFPY